MGQQEQQSAQHTTGPAVWMKPGQYGLQPVGTRWNRAPTIAEVVHFETCHAAGAYSAINAQVPPWVPVWQYVAADERAAAMRKCVAITKATGSN